MAHLLGRALAENMSRFNRRLQAFELNQRRLEQLEISCDVVL